jgi:short subunit dehydrogenase-like uncharacterized protein
LKPPNPPIVVFGAYGHTGRFVVAELHKRGWTPILSGRDAAKLAVLAKEYSGSEVRPASVDDPASLDHAIVGACAVINCAGPFIDTAAPVIEAAIRSGAHYLDIAAEQPAVLSVFERFAGPAREAGLLIVPAMAFYGGLGDLLATRAMGDWASADEILIGTALDSWNPTRGTRLTGKRNPGQHVTYSDSKLDPTDPLPRMWTFPAPFGRQEVVGLSLSETITISRHLHARQIHAYINHAPIKDISNPETPPPTAADGSGRSSQVFLMETIARKGNAERRAVARGRDIYAITAPLAVEAARRVVNGLVLRTSGVVAPGEAFDAPDFLSSLARADLSFENR